VWLPVGRIGVAPTPFPPEGRREHRGHPHGFRPGDEQFHPSAASSCAQSAERRSALATLDRMVPTGQPMTSAASAYGSRVSWSARRPRAGLVRHVGRRVSVTVADLAAGYAHAERAVTDLLLLGEVTLVAVAAWRRRRTAGAVRSRPGLSA
jgi:hypothetical protein